MDDRTPIDIPGYKIIYELGGSGASKGGMARVFKAERLDNGQKRAIKVLRTELAGRKEVVDGFYREWEIMARLKCSNTVHVYESSRSHPVGSLHYFTMEWIEGCDLAEYVRDRGPLSEKDAITCARTILRTLEYIHGFSGERIIHRDLRPANIRIEAGTGRIVLLDFGIAVSGDQPSDQQTWGNPYYMSPEHLEPRKICPESDLYSMGAILFFMVTKAVPFTDPNGNPANIALQHCNTPPPSPRLLNAAISPELEQVILKAMEKDPKKRYHSARDFEDALVASGVIIEKLPSRIIPQPGVDTQDKQPGSSGTGIMGTHTGFPTGLVITLGSGVLLVIVLALILLLIPSEDLLKNARKDLAIADRTVGSFENELKQPVELDFVEKTVQKVESLLNSVPARLAGVPDTINEGLKKQKTSIGTNLFSVVKTWHEKEAEASKMLSETEWKISKLEGEIGGTSPVITSVEESNRAIRAQLDEIRPSTKVQAVQRKRLLDRLSSTVEAWSNRQQQEARRRKEWHIQLSELEKEIRKMTAEITQGWVEESALKTRTTGLRDSLKKIPDDPQLLSVKTDLATLVDEIGGSWKLRRQYIANQYGNLVKESETIYNEARMGQRTTDQVKDALEGVRKATESLPKSTDFAAERAAVDAMIDKNSIFQLQVGRLVDIEGQLGALSRAVAERELTSVERTSMSALRKEIESGLKDEERPYLRTRCMSLSTKILTIEKDDFDHKGAAEKEKQLRPILDALPGTAERLLASVKTEGIMANEAQEQIEKLREEIRQVRQLANSEVSASKADAYLSKAEGVLTIIKKLEASGVEVFQYAQAVKIRLLSTEEEKEVIKLQVILANYLKNDAKVISEKAQTQLDIIKTVLTRQEKIKIQQVETQIAEIEENANALLKQVKNRVLSYSEVVQARTRLAESILSWPGAGTGGQRRMDSIKDTLTQVLLTELNLEIEALGDPPVPDDIGYLLARLSEQQKNIGQNDMELLVERMAAPVAKAANAALDAIASAAKVVDKKATGSSLDQFLRLNDKYIQAETTLRVTGLSKGKDDAIRAVEKGIRHAIDGLYEGRDHKSLSKEDIRTRKMEIEDILSWCKEKARSFGVISSSCGELEQKLSDIKPSPDTKKPGLSDPIRF